MYTIYKVFYYDKIHKFKECNIYQKTLLGYFYRLSSFFYSLLGLLVLSNIKKLKKYDNRFPWKFLGLLNVINGLVIYIGDVIYFGKKNRIVKNVDKAVSSLNMFITWPVMVLRYLLGYSKFPMIYILIHGFFGFLAIYFKYMSTYELRHTKSNNCNNYMLWHGLWHCYPLFAFIYISHMLKN